MKIKFRYMFTGLLMAFAVTACDLNTAPTTSLDANAVYKDTKNADRVLRGVWNNIFNSGSTYASIGLGSIMANNDFSGSDVVRLSPTYGFSGSYSLKNGYSRGEYNSVLWDLIYPAINGCNGIIKNIDKVEGASEDKARIKAQALATRGFMYMMLASNYSFAIDKDPDAVCAPIYTEPTTGADLDVALNGVAASSVTEVYQQALTDLVDALDVMPEGYSHGSNAVDQYKIDYQVILGLLARTNLYARNWEQAYNYASEVLKLNNYLMTEAEYKSGFNDCSNKEWIWGYSSTVDDNMPSYLFHFKDTSTDGSYYHCFYLDPYFKEKFADGDYRKTMMDWAGDPGVPITAATSEVYMSYSKFRFKGSPSDMLGDIVLMRVSEMYLIKAEAAAHIAGKETEAQQTLATLRAARGDRNTVTTTGSALLEEIWLERRKELWGEGFALTDIIRNQQKVERKIYEGNLNITDNGKTVSIPCKGHNVTNAPDGTEFTINSKYYLYRIPESEELQNKNLYSKYPRLSIYDK